MSTVRFAKVVASCGKPEVFLLLNKDDPDFQKALKANRVMSLLGQSEGKTDYGEVGYDEKKRPQLLVFPKSLKRFEGDRVVGIKYDEFSEVDYAPATKTKTAAKVNKANAKKPPKAEHSSEPEQAPPQKVKKPDKKPPVKKARPEKPPSRPRVAKPKKAKASPKEEKKAEREKVIPFPSPKTEERGNDEDEDSDLEKSVRQAMVLLEKGNSVAAYNVLQNAVGD